MNDTVVMEMVSGGKYSNDTAHRIIEDKKRDTSHTIASSWITENSFAICECIIAEQRDNEAEKLPMYKKQ